MDITKLKAELTDPRYSGMTDEEVAIDLNTVNRTRNVESVTGHQIFEAVAPGEYSALSADDRTLLLGIIGMGTILVNGDNTKTALLAMFGAGTDTRTNLAALQTEDVSRATELGLGKFALSDIAKARV